MKLPSYLFWDVDQSTIDLKKNARFVIQRVIQRGSLKEWSSIKAFYGIDVVKKEILAMRSLDKKTLNFFSTYFNLHKNTFRCFSIQQSTLMAQTF